MRRAFDWHSIVSDAVGAAVALYYVSLRHSYRALLNGPKMFDDKNGQLLRATLSALDEGVVVYQRDRGVVDANEAATAILGLPREELLGLALDAGLFECFREDGSPWSPDLLPVAATFASGMGHSRTVVGFRRDDGQHQWLSCSTAPLRDVAGAVEYVVATFTDVTAERAAAELMAWRALHDELTGLANRSLLYDRLEGSLASAGSDDRSPYAVLFCDLDGFKAVNDRFGHSVGDALLVSAADRLAAVMREGDMVARWGGDEFVVLASGSTHRSRSASRRADGQTIRRPERNSGRILTKRVRSPAANGWRSSPAAAATSSGSVISSARPMAITLQPEPEASKWST